VLAPFAALAWANRRHRLYAGSVAIAAISLPVYGAVATGLLRAKIGFIFLVVPAVSLVAVAAALGAGRLRNK
jgi:hypothetical protein